MDRKTFHGIFGSAGSVVLTVIHVLNDQKMSENIDIACGEGASGVFLINHDF